MLIYLFLLKFVFCVQFLAIFFTKINNSKAVRIKFLRALAGQSASSRLDPFSQCKKSCLKEEARTYLSEDHQRSADFLDPASPKLNTYQKPKDINTVKVKYP